MIRTLFAALGLAGLAACGGGNAPAIEDAETPPVQAETEGDVADTSASPGYGPPAISFAQDGDVITGKVGEEISVKLALPDGVSTSIQWHKVEGDYLPVVEHDKTWAALEGSQRYSDIILRGAAVGETTVTLHVLEMGQRYSDEERTLTIRISQ